MPTKKTCPTKQPPSLADNDISGDVPQNEAESTAPFILAMSEPANSIVQVDEEDQATWAGQAETVRLESDAASVAAENSEAAPFVITMNGGPESASPASSGGKNHAETAPLSMTAPQGSIPADLPPEALAGMDGEMPTRYSEARGPGLRMPTQGTTDAKAKPDKPGGKDHPQKPAKPRRPSPVTRIEPGFAQRAFQFLSYAGLPVLLALVALMTLQEMFTLRSLWFSDEVRHADVYMRLLGGDWLVLSLNGLPYPDKPPLYFWFLRGLDAIPGVDEPRLFFLGTAISAMLFTASVWLLARATGHDRRVAFAAGLMTIGCMFVAGLTQYPRMDLMFAAVINLSLICLYRGWIKPSAPLWLTFGFVLAGVATLIKGPLALAFPLLSSILFLIWRGSPGRMNGRDGLVGFALMLFMLLAWMGALLFQGESIYLKEILGPQIAGRMVNSWHHAMPWWYYLAALPLVWLPWTFLALFINWWRAARSVPAAWKARKEAGGRGWLWIVLISGVVALSLVSGKIAIYLLPLMPALAVLSARALLNLTPRRSRWFFLMLAVFLGLLGLILIAAHFNSVLLPLAPETWFAKIPAVAHAYLDNISGLLFMGLVLLVLSALLIFFSRRSLPGGALLLTALGLIAMMESYALLVAPSLDTMLSPKAQAAAMAEYVHKGYAAASYRVYPGVYSYYLNNRLAFLDFGEEGNELERRTALIQDIDNRDDLDAFLAEHPHAVVVMREKDWAKWENKPGYLQVVERQWMVDQPYVLMMQDRPETDAVQTVEPDAIQMVNPDVAQPLAPQEPASGDAPGVKGGLKNDTATTPGAEPPVSLPDTPQPLLSNPVMEPDSMLMPQRDASSI